MIVDLTQFQCPSSSSCEGLPNFLSSSSDVKMASNTEVISLLSQCVTAVELSFETPPSAPELYGSQMFNGAPGSPGGGNDYACLPSHCTLPRKKKYKDGGPRSPVKSPVSTLPEQAARVVEAAIHPGHLQLQDLQQQLLHSGLAVYTGSCDRNGSTLVLVFCEHTGWQTENFATTELARLLLYYHSLQRLYHKEGHSGLALIVDARGTTLPVLNALLTTLHTVQDTDPHAITIVHMLTDRNSKGLLFCSSIFQPSVDNKINMVTNMQTMHQFVEGQELPTIMGGTLSHSHQMWVAFRRDVEVFLQRCRQAASFLVRVMTDISALSRFPVSVSDAENIIERHQEGIRAANEDSSLMALIEEGPTVLAKLGQELTTVSHCSDCRESLTVAEKLYSSVQSSLDDLRKLADRRLQQLLQCLERRRLQHRLSEEAAWYEMDGESILKKYTPDLYGNADVLQQKFDQDYIEIKRQLHRSKDLLAEADQLTRSGSRSDVDGIKEATQALKTHMDTFSEQLEGVKSTIANNATCQNLIDKCYKWAYGTMKYIRNSRDENSSVEEVEKLLSNLELYMKEQPPVSEENILSMISLAEDIQKPNLLEKCQKVRTRCREAYDLLQQRQCFLQQRLEQLRANGDVFARPHPYTVTGIGTNSPNTWSTDFSSPYGSFNDYMCRRRSYAGKPSAPLYSPAAAAFRANVRDLNLTEFEEHLFNEGLITEDMSDRIVTSLPKGLSDCTLRSSRESLRGSRESLGSCENIYESLGDSTQTQTMSSSVPSNSCGSFQSMMAAQKVSQRKTNSLGRTVMERDLPDGVPRENKRNSRPLSMLTGSTESLPSMPEEDEDDLTEAADSNDHAAMTKSMWAPPAPPSDAPGKLRSFHSVADLRLTDDEVKRRKTLAHVMDEMLQTEKLYARDLLFVVDNYIPELQGDDVPQALQGKRNVIFSNLEKIWQFHSQEFLPELIRTKDTPLMVARCFQRHFEDFYLYALYNKNKPKSDELLADHGAKFFKRKQLELKDSLDLSSYLLKPVQRLGKYALLLKQILKECPAADQEHGHIQRAIDMVKFLLRHGNDLLAMDSLRDCDVSLQEQGQLLRQEEFVIWQGRKKSIRRVFLFEELIVLSKPKRNSSGHDIYTYKNSIKMADVGLTENIGGRGLRFEIWFRKLKNRPGDTFTLQSPSMEVKESWVRDISKLLWRQAIKNRELRRQEMVRMGIGNKPGVDIKPSKDNIQDRFVHTTRYQVPRFRNSIAVSSVEHLRNASKRPNSIISTISSSSSSGYSSAHSGSQCPSYARPVTGSKAAASTTGSVESGFVSDLGSGCGVQEDACTQTTLRRSSLSAMTTATATYEATETMTSSSHLFTTDV